MESDISHYHSHYMERGSYSHYPRKYGEGELIIFILILIEELNNKRPLVI